MEIINNSLGQRILVEIYTKINYKLLSKPHDEYDIFIRETNLDGVNKNQY